jgi:hypothetical protein
MDDEDDIEYTVNMDGMIEWVKRNAMNKGYDEYSNQWSKKESIFHRPYETTKEEGWGPIGWRQQELDEDYAALKKREDKLAIREKKLKAAQKKLDEQQRKQELTPTKRLKEALVLEAELVAERAKIDLAKKGHKAKIRDFNAECKKVQKDLDRAAGMVEEECQKTIDKAAKKLEAESRKKTKKLDEQQRAQTQEKTFLKNEENRLTQIRHELSDKEANLVRRENAVKRAEISGGGTVQPTTDGKHRALEL